MWTIRASGERSGDLRPRSADAGRGGLEPQPEGPGLQPRLTRLSIHPLALLLLRGRSQLASLLLRASGLPPHALPVGCGTHAQPPSLVAPLLQAPARQPPTPTVMSLATRLQISRYGVFVSKVTGPSMWPTFAGRSDFVVAEALTPAFGTLQHGEGCEQLHTIISSRPWMAASKWLSAVPRQGRCRAQALERRHAPRNWMPQACQQRGAALALSLPYPAAGDVVICTRPVDPAESIIKRVVAMEARTLIYSAMLPSALASCVHPGRSTAAPACLACLLDIL